MWIKLLHGGIVVKIFELRILLCTDLHAGVVVVTKLLLTTLRRLYTIHFLFLLCKWLPFDFILLEGNLDNNWSAWFIFSDKLCPYQGNCSTWVIFSDKLSPYQGTSSTSDFSRQAVYTLGDNCSTWVIFPDKLSPHGEMKGIFNWFLVLFSCRFERLRNWLTAPFRLFPYMVRGNHQLLVTI